jgi:hypothetical protein
MEALQKVRVLLVGMSNMLSEIVTATLAQAPDIVVAGDVAYDEDLGLQIRATAAGAIIVQTTHPGTAATFIRLLHNFPALKVVAINASGSVGFLHQLRPYSLRFAEVSADMLLAALRAPSGAIRRSPGQ